MTETHDARAQGGPLPPTLFLLALVLQLVAHLVLPVTRVVSGWWRLVGAIPVALGFGLAVVADRQFERARTPVHPFHRPKALVTEGTFAYSRNPMYLGMLAILFGVALALGSLTPFIAVPAFAWLLTARFIRTEEANLTGRFGDEYAAYAKRVRRWLWPSL